jgi:RNA polymerase sigma-70 factor (ECF subfamily)
MTISQLDPQLELQSIDWDMMYWNLRPRIYNFFHYRLNDVELANDLTSITFIKAWRAREQYRNELGAFEAWLFAIARNVAYDFFRKIQRQK